MSKRFGRNQRRKMREELAQAQARIEHIQVVADQTYVGHASTIKMLRETLAKANFQLDHVTDALARYSYSALLPPTVFVTGGDPAYIRAVDTDGLNYREPYAIDGVNWNRRTQRVSLLRLGTLIERQPMLQTSVHMFVEGSGKYAGKWRYSISDNALAAGLSRVARADICWRVANELLDAFEAHIVKQRYG